MVQDLASLVPQMSSADDPVRRAMSLNTLRVSAASRPFDFLDYFEWWNITHCLVFDEAAQLLGVVELRSLVRHWMTRIFADLLPLHPAPTISIGTPVEELCERFRDPGVSCLIVQDRGIVHGLITRDSFRELLLHEEPLPARSEDFAAGSSFN
jgi:signal-transduction protein with cAMP-binding, CBS, and nucleotidyltransferase domain